VCDAISQEIAARRRLARADGIYAIAGLEQEKAALWVMIGRKPNDFRASFGRP
jgi:hypothetical protein